MRNSLVYGVVCQAFTIGLLSFVCMTTALAQIPEEFTLDIPAQPLNSALIDLAEKTGATILAPGHLESAKSVPSLSGTFTIERAISILIRETNLTFERNERGAYVLSSSPDRSSAPKRIQLDTMVVQGQKIGRTLRDTPASTTVISGIAADTPLTPNNRASVQGIPNVFAEEGFSVPSIRGIDGSAGAVGAASFTTGAQARVNTLVDGVARPITISDTPTLNSTWDLSSIEVARGPQSTISGRNSLGGAIRIQTNDPVFEYEAAARGTYFNRNGTVGGALMLNAPIVEEQVAFRFTAEASKGETFVDVRSPFVSQEIADRVEEQRQRRYRGKLLVEPDKIDGLSVLVTADHSRREDLFGTDVSDTSSLVNADFGNSNSLDISETTVVSGKVAYDISNLVEVEANVSFLKNDFFIPFNGAFPLQIPIGTETLSSEGLVRVGRIGPLRKGVLGVAYEDTSDDGVNELPGLPLVMRGQIENIAVFGEVEVGLLESLVLIAGGRYEVDERSRQIAFGGNSNSIETEDSVFIPKIGIRYELNDRIVTGYTYSEGFRHGGVDFDLFNPSGAISIFGPEALRQHEVYARSNFLNDRLKINASTFYYTFEDAITLGADPNGTGLAGNLPEAIGYGFELDAEFDLTDSLTVSGGVGLLETEITDAGFRRVVEGSELPQAPDVTAQIAARYYFDNGLDMLASARYVGHGIDFVGAGNTEFGSYTVVDFALGYEAEVNNLRSIRFDFFVQNLGDKRYITGGGAGAATVSIGRPRTVGLSATARF